MDKEIPIDMLINLMKSAEQEGTLKMTDEGENIRIKGIFIIKNGKDN